MMRFFNVNIFLVAEFLRNLVLMALLLFIALFFWHLKPQILISDLPLNVGTNQISIRDSFLGFFYQEELQGDVDVSILHQFDINLLSRIGHLHLETQHFQIPIIQNDKVLIWVSKIGDNPQLGAKIKNATIYRRPLPGAWLFIFWISLAFFYLHLWVRKDFTREQILVRLIAGGSFFLALVLGAILVQLFYSSPLQSLPWHLYPPNTSKKIYVYPNIMPGVPEGVVWFKTNSEGIRARERNLSNWPAAFSVMCLGASTTEGFFLGEEYHWPAMLESRLKGLVQEDVWVGNVGHSGYGTKQLCRVAKDYIPQIRPRYLVLLTGFNEGIVPDHENAWAIQDLYAVAESKFMITVRLYLKRVVLLRLIKRIFFNKFVTSPNDVLVGNNNLSYVADRLRLKMYSRINPPKDRSWDDMDLGGFENAIREINDVAIEYKTKLILCTQPTIYRDDLTQTEKDLLWLMGNYTLRSKKKRMDLVNQKIREVGRKFNIPVIDLDKRLPKSTEVFYDDCHFNRRGATLVAEEVFGYFKSTELISKLKQ